MVLPVIRFPSGRLFKIDATPLERDFIMLFLGENALREYFGVKKQEEIPSCVSLPLLQNEAWGKKGDLVDSIVLSGANQQRVFALLADYPELEKNRGFYFLCPSSKKGFDSEIEVDHLSCYYTLYHERWYPVAYTPFQPSVIELDSEKTYDFIAFGSENSLSVAVLEGQEIHVSPVFGKLIEWNQLEMAHQWMENERKTFTSKGVIFHEYYHESLLHTYLARYGQKSTYTHTNAHFANVLFDNHFTNTPLLGVIFDREDHTSQATIEGSDIVYGTMAKNEILASWRPLPIPGNASNFLDPWRITLAVLRDVIGDLDGIDIPFMRHLRKNQEIHYVIEAINKRVINVTPSSSMTHIIIALFELLDYRALIEEYDMVSKRIDEIFLSGETGFYEVDVIQEEGHAYLDTYELIRLILREIKETTDYSQILHKAIHSLFWNTARLVKGFSQQYHEHRVAVSGDLFTHPQLLHLMEHYLRSMGMEPICHRHIPTGDSGAALGALLHVLAQKEAKCFDEEE